MVWHTASSRLVCSKLRNFSSSSSCPIANSKVKTKPFFIKLKEGKQTWCRCVVSVADTDRVSKWVNKSDGEHSSRKWWAHKHHSLHSCDTEAALFHSHSALPFCLVQLCVMSKCAQSDKRHSALPQESWKLGNPEGINIKFEFWSLCAETQHCGLVDKTSHCSSQIKAVRSKVQRSSCILLVQNHCCEEIMLVWCNYIISVYATMVQMYRNAMENTQNADLQFYFCRTKIKHICYQKTCSHHAFDPNSTWTNTLILSSWTGWWFWQLEWQDCIN